MCIYIYIYIYIYRMSVFSLVTYVRLLQSVSPQSFILLCSLWTKASLISSFIPITRCRSLYLTVLPAIWCVSFLFPCFFLEQNKPLCPKRPAGPHQRAVWGREEKGFDETGVWRTTQKWSHHNVRSSILQQPSWICHEQICLLRLLQVQKGSIFTSCLFCVVFTNLQWSTEAVVLNNLPCILWPRKLSESEQLGLSELSL